MVIRIIREALKRRRLKKVEEDIEQNKLESYRENEQLEKADLIKKEADRLAHLKQYKTAIDEYYKALEIYPFNEKEQMFKKSAEFFFKLYFNIAASYSFLNKFNESIEYFDKALKIENIEDENKVKALMSKGNCYYRTKQLLDEGHEEGTYTIRMESEFNIDDETFEIFKKLDEKEGLLKLAHTCFFKTTELDKNDADAWYKKGHMEFLLGQVKESMLSFDNVLMVKKDYENKENIELFDDIKMEKGIKAKHSKVLETDMKFKTKTGHYVANKSEKMIANFLFENNLIFQYNMAVSWADKDEFKATFYIPKLDLYLEHFNNHPKSLKSKIKQYDKNKKKLVYTTYEDEMNIEEALKIKLKPYIVL